MALSILDGNQSATTLSTILSSGQHITAHTVVSLGTQAITDMRGAVSGSVVSVSSLPAISGTVTANLDSASNSFWGSGNSFATAVQGGLINYSENEAPFPISGVVTVSNIQTVTLGTSVGATTKYPTAIVGYDVTNGAWQAVPLSEDGDCVIVGNANGEFASNNLLPISGTVTANTFALQGTAVTTSNFTSTTASTVLASYNATREVLTIFNEGAGNLHICAGATCTTIAYQVRLSAGDYYEVPNHQTTITHSAVFATAGTARVTEVS
jgi:hypothetical protein